MAITYTKFWAFVERHRVRTPRTPQTKVWVNLTKTF